jgi:alkanesulfonate monooxygenase SsuD/methylene tetrahydromethanopterin reductase-like flavin-dependent oxidoreductase (luciferase family)
VTLRFGVSVVPSAEDVGAVLDLVDAADAIGLDLVGVQDHPYQRRFLDTWTLIATLLARTERVRVFPDVANLPLRPPALMAKAAASLDILSAGRFELGLGAGGFLEHVAAMGGPTLTSGQSVEALAEAIEVIRLMWSGEPSVSFDGRHYRLHDLKPGPRPAHPIGIWVGAYRPRMLALVGSMADGWVPSLFRGVTPEDLSAWGRVIDEAALAAGRDPAAIRRVYNVPGRIRASGPGDGPLDGPPERWAETLARWAVEDRADSFVFWPQEPGREQLERFANEVAPAVRAAAGAA